MADGMTRDPRAPGWKRDPSGRFFGRYWDGEQWTEHVISEDKVRAVDPIPPRPSERQVPPPVPPAARPAATRPMPLAQREPEYPIVDQSPSFADRVRAWPNWAKWAAGIFAVLLIIGAASGGGDDGGVATVGDQQVTSSSAVETTVTAPPATASTPTTTPTPTTTVAVTTTRATVATTAASTAPTSMPRAVYYANCAAARAAGAAPLYRGEPGYGRHLDRDDDGVACET